MGRRTHAPDQSGLRARDTYRPSATKDFGERGVFATYQTTWTVGGSSKLCLLSLPPSTQLSNRSPGAAKDALAPTKGMFRIPFLGLSEIKPNQNLTMLHLSRSLLPIVQLPACFVPRRTLARTDGPRRGPLQGPLQRPLEGLGGRRGGWAAGRAGGLKGTWGTQGGPGEARGGQGGPGGARGLLGKPGEAARGGPGPRGKIREAPAGPGRR